MAYNPKVALSKLTQKDVSKKDISKLGKKAVDAATAQPFFICANHKFSDGKEGPLFLFGKLAKVKAEIKALKGPEHLHGVAFVTTDDKGKTTLNLLPSKGKLDNKETILKKAMKDAFTQTYADFKIGAPITEEAAEKLAEAAELLEDVADEAEVSTTEGDTAATEKETPTTESADSGDKKDVKAVAALIQETSGLIKAKVSQVVANIKAKNTSNADTTVIEEVTNKIAALKTSFEALSEKDKAPLTKNYEQIMGQVPAVEKIKAALANGGNAGDDLEKFLKEIEATMNKTSGALDKAIENVKSAPATSLPSGADLLNAI